MIDFLNAMARSGASLRVDLQDNGNLSVRLDKTDDSGVCHKAAMSFTQTALNYAVNPESMLTALVEKIEASAATDGEANAQPQEPL